MRYYVTLILFFVGLTSIFAQIDAGADITICEIQPVNLSADYTPNSVGTSDYILENVPYTSENYTGTVVNLFDDDEEGPFEIGFEFCFFDNVYTQFCIGSNGWITFSCGQPTTYVSGPIPNALAPLNSIMAPWSDWNPSVGGEIRYETIGAAPNRSLVVSWIDVPLYGGACGAFQGKFQIVLRESTNIIENNIEYKTNCPDDGAGGSDIAVQGIQNIDGTIAIVVPGRNATAWETANESHHYTPIGLAVTNVQWYDENNVNVGAGTDIVVNPTGTMTYTAIAQECPTAYSDEVTIFVSEPPVVTSNIDDNLCPGELFGSIDLNVNGAFGPYTFNWSSASGSYTSNFEDINNLSPDSYSVEITDAFDCVSNEGPYIISPTPEDFSVTASIEGVSCFGFSDGSVEISTTGGTPNYSYSWSGPTLPINGDGTSNITDLPTGTYQIVITDNNNCVTAADFFVNENIALNIISNYSDYNGFNVRCYGSSDGWASTVVSGGATPYTYAWVNQNTLDTLSITADLPNIGAGDYTLYVTDAEGCPNSIAKTFTQPDSITLDISNYSHKSCTYNIDGFIDVNVWGGPDNPPFSENYNNYQYQWVASNSFQSNQEDINYLDVGTYRLVVTDINQCTNEISFEINEPPQIISDYRTLDDTISINYPYVNIYDNSVGNVTEWNWKIGDNYMFITQNILDLDLSMDLDEDGIQYFDIQLIVIDEFGCTDTSTGVIAIKDEHSLFIPDAFTPDLDGKNDLFKVFHHAMDVGSYTLNIFDRFGTTVFSSTDPNEGWDGTHKDSGNKLIKGVYTYSLSYKDFEGRIYDFTNCENCTGTISLLR